MIAGIASIYRYWLPPSVDRQVIEPQLARFYAQRTDYHEMTAAEDKVDHPQVRLLLSMIGPTDTVVEFGCGGGVVLQAVTRVARRAIGFDIGDIALVKARQRSRSLRLAKSDVSHVPLGSRSVDLAYSCEVLEHVWNPADVIREMVRVVKPGGRIFFSTPNGYAMNLHLPLRRGVRLANHLGAAACLIRARIGNRLYQNIPPDLDANPVYPDCDMITRIHPRILELFARRCGCRIDRLETFFFQRAKAASDAERARFAYLEHHRFYRWYGDHILMLATKIGDGLTA